PDQIGEEPHGAGKSTGAASGLRPGERPGEIDPALEHRRSDHRAGGTRVPKGAQILERSDPACAIGRPAGAGDAPNEVHVRTAEPSHPIDRGHEEGGGAGRVEPADGAHQIESVGPVPTARPSRPAPTLLDLQPYTS